MKINSWKPEVFVRGFDTWNSDSMRFATKAEAEKAGVLELFVERRYRDLPGVPIRSRVVQSEEAVNYVFDDAAGRPSPIDA